MKYRFTSYLYWAVLVVLFFQEGNLMAQSHPIAYFPEIMIEFDSMPEEGGPVSRTVTVFNRGDAVLRLLDVRAGCGCTTPHWETSPILPGDSGNIEIVYDPTGRPGHFLNAVVVSTNDPERTTVFLQMKGKVIPRPKTIEELYPYPSGSLRFQYLHITLGEAYLGEIKRDTFFLVNQSDKAVRFLIKRSEIPAYFKVKAIPASVGPGQKAILIVDYIADKRKDWGVLFDSLIIATDDALEPNKKLSVSAKVLAPLHNLSARQLAVAPRLEIPRDAFRFGQVKKAEIVEFTFTLKNTGASSLSIRKVSAACPCIEIGEFPREILPGGSIALPARFDTQGLFGSQHKTITVITDDPGRQEVYLHFIGTVH